MNSLLQLVSAQNPIIEPDMIGMFCSLIKRQVFEELPKPWFKYYFEGDREIGEDFYFCRASREAGFKITVNTNVKLDHMAVCIDQ